MGKRSSSFVFSPLINNGESPIYSIDGRRMEHPLPKGIYIQNGKKVVQ